MPDAQKELFISREHVSPLWLAPLHQKGWRVKHLSFVQFTPVPFSILPATDWIAFYSATGAIYFITHLEEKSDPNYTIKPDGLYHLDTDTRLKISVLGPGTARVLLSKGWTIDHTGAGQPTLWAKELNSVAAGQRVLSPRARSSRETLRHFANSSISLIDLICYDNTPLQSPPLVLAPYMLFTSPLQANTYFKHHARQLGQTFIAIGPTTAKELALFGITAPWVPPSPVLSEVCHWLAHNLT